MIDLLVMSGPEEDHKTLISVSVTKNRFAFRNVVVLLAVLQGDQTMSNSSHGRASHPLKTNCADDGDWR